LGGEHCILSSVLIVLGCLNMILCFFESCLNDSER